MCDKGLLGVEAPRKGETMEEAMNRQILELQRKLFDKC